MQLKVSQENAPILSNVGEARSFKMKATAKSFQILSSGLYPNKPRAIVREITCNAVDSHVAAGKSEVPVLVHLPNSFEPWFSVKDFGVGLNEDEIYNVYTTYFESTKTDSNDYTGCLGLGSKSPFSYTDNFTVTSIKDGLQTIYSSFLNNAGVPDIVKLSQTASDQQNGVEVKLAVKTEDFDKFYNEAMDIFRYFKTTPKVVGRDFVLEEIVYNTLDLMPGVSIRENFDRFSSKNRFQAAQSGRSYAIMGNVAYPIDAAHLANSLGNLAQYLNNNLDIRFEIGDLDIQASREGLSYIPETVAAIKAKMQGINEVLEAKFAERADAVQNLWQRARFLNKEVQVSIWKASVLSYGKNHKNPLLKDTVGSISRYALLQEEPKTLLIKDLAEKYNIEFLSYSTGYSSRVSRSKFSVASNTAVNYNKPVEQHVISIPVLAKTVIYINDLPKQRGMLSRLNHNAAAITKEGHSFVFEIRAKDLDKPMLWQDFVKDIHDYEDTVLASTLEPAPPKPKSTKAQ